jgi:hypothetical protein
MSEVNVSESAPYKSINLSPKSYARRALISREGKYNDRAPSLERRLFMAEYPELKNQVRAADASQDYQFRDPAFDGGQE